MSSTDLDSAQPAALPDPAKLLRLGSMIKQLLEETRAMPLDARSRERLTATYDRAVAELEACLPAVLRAEFTRVAPALHTGAAMSDAELRIAQAQLIGWLEGLFQGVQFAAAVRQVRADRARG